MQTITKHKTKIIAGGVALFAVLAIFVGLHLGSSKAQACSTGCFPPVDVTCTASASTVFVGEKVTYTAHPTGGDTYYAFSWTGSDGLTDNKISTTKSYSTAGTKKATVTAFSNGTSKSATCTVTVKDKVVPPPPCDKDCFPPVDVFCTASVSTIDINEPVTFTAHPSGGDKFYAFSWTGSDGLTGNKISVTKSYNTSGSKTATVTAFSNGTSKSATCKVTVNEKNVPPPPPPPTLTGFCEGSPSTVDEDEDVTWTAFPSGGTGSYQYDWSGDDGLDGNNKSETISYNDDGTKEATVKITSGNQSITRTCTIFVRSENNNNDKNLDAFCEADDSTVKVGDRVTWEAHPSGSFSSNYKYDWSGDDGLDGDDKEESITYDTPGTKDAEVRVSLKDDDGFDDDEVTAHCHVNVVNNTQGVIYVPPTPTQTGVFLDTIPATGISPTVKTALFTSGMLIWSAFLGYLFIRRRNMKLAEQRMIDEALNS